MPTLLGAFPLARYDWQLDRAAWCTGAIAFGAARAYLFNNNAARGEALRIWRILGVSVILNTSVNVYTTAQTGGTVIGTGRSLILDGPAAPGVITDVSWAAPPADRRLVDIITTILVSFTKFSSAAPLYILAAGDTLGFQGGSNNSPSGLALLYDWEEPQ